MLTFLQDLRYAGRQLYKNRWISLTAILSLALGIGATVSVFSIIYAVLMNPWPYQGADRIDNIALMDKSGKEQNYGLNGPQTRELAKAHSLEYVVAFNGWNLTVTGGDVPEDVQANYFTGNVFQMLGVPALMGRYFLPSDAPDGQDPQPVVVLLRSDVYLPLKLAGPPNEQYGTFVKIKPGVKPEIAVAELEPYFKQF